uniref:Uncharacterized protein n=1 Tax=Hippocampus comes TaxID=109280 RepID=A0A3Q2XAN7_HIPCM
PHQTALHRAAILGNSDAISALIQGGCALDLQNRDGNTALHEVSWHGFLQCVKLLVKAGANVHIKNKAGNTALHLASQNDHAQTARLLLLGGATPDTKNKVRETALHVAAALSHKRTVQLLLDSGADGKIRNNVKCIRISHFKTILIHVAICHSSSLEVCELLTGSSTEFHLKRDPIARDNSRISYGNCFHLYTLYRDTDGNVRQAPANGCHCRPKIKKLEEKLKGTQEELRLHILNMHEQVDSRLRKMDRKSKHQVFHGLMPVAYANQLSPHWLFTPAFLPRHGAQKPPRRLWIILDTPDVLPSSTGRTAPLFCRGSSPDPVDCTGASATRAAPSSGHRSAASTSLHSPRVAQTCRVQNRGSINSTWSTSRRPPRNSSRNINRHALAHLARSANSAAAVTQHFFETVSIQLERWYERKVLEVEEQTKVKMEQERQELLQHINVLEEELQKLKTGVNAET